MKRAWIILCCLFLFGCLFWFFPLFHVTRIQRVEDTPNESAFNAANFAKIFWKEQLAPSLAQVPDAATVLAAFRSDPEMARTRFGRKVGVSRTRLVILRGGGAVVKVDKTGVGVALQSDSKEADIVLQTGLLFGNTVRDATGLLDASSFPDSRQFNEISTELNRIVETRIIAMLKTNLVVGQNIHFAGCTEIPDESEIARPLKIIPLDIRVE